MIKRMILCVGFMLPVWLAGCSDLPKKYQVFRDNSNDYLQSTPLPPLKIPPGYSSNTIDDYYPVPHASNNLAEKSPDLLPPNIDPKTAPPVKSWWKK